MSGTGAMFSATHQAAEVAGASCHQHSGAREGLHYGERLTGGGHSCLLMCCKAWRQLHFHRVQWQVPSTGVHIAAHSALGLPGLPSAPWALLAHKRLQGCSDQAQRCVTFRAFTLSVKRLNENNTRQTRTASPCPATCGDLYDRKDLV